MSLQGMVKIKDDSGQVNYFHAQHVNNLTITPIEQTYHDIQGQPKYACMLYGEILYAPTPVKFTLFYKNNKTAEKIADKLMNIGNKKL